MKYRIGLRLGPTDVEAWVFDLPGCFTVAPSVVGVKELLPLVIAEHLAWLKSHGEPARDDLPLEIAVVEELAKSREDEFCFSADLEPVTNTDIDTAVRRMDFARRDLFHIVSKLPVSVMNWRPPLSAAAKVDSWALDIRSIAEILDHIAGTDYYYRTALSVQEPEQESQEELRDLVLQRERAVNHLRTILAEQGDTAFRIRRRYWNNAVEEWTVRKALRRFIWHERFHAREIEQRLSWLILGVPELPR